MSENESNPRLPFDPRKAFWLVAGALAVWLVWDAISFRLVTYSPQSDYWEHTAALTEWSRNITDPANPHVADPAPSPRYMPWFLTLVLIGRVLALDAVQLMGLSAVAGFVLLVVGIRLFFRTYFRSDVAPLIALFVLLFGWGVSWIWSNLYQLRSFFHVAGYPSSIVFGLSLISFWITLRWLRGQAGAWIGAGALLVLAALMFLTHPLTAVFGISGCVLLALTEPGASRRVRWVVPVALFAGAFLAELWPWFSVWDVTLGRGGSVDTTWLHGAVEGSVLDRLRSGVWRHPFYDPKLLLVIVGFGLPAVVAWGVLLWRRREPFIVFGGLAMLTPYVAHLFVAVPLAHRFLLFAIFYFHMAGVWAVLRLLGRWLEQRASGTVTPRTRVALLGTALLFASATVFNVRQLAMEYDGKHLLPTTLDTIDKFANVPGGGNVVDLYEALTAGVGPREVVMATAVDGWPLPTVAGKVVSLFHENPLLPKQFERRDAVRRFFAPETSEDERRALLARYDARFVLVRAEKAPASLLAWLPRIATETARRGDYRMYRLDGATER